MSSISAQRVSVPSWLTPQLSLVVAGALVALSILLGAPLARPLNGIAGLLWIASAVWMVWSLRGQPRKWPVLAVAGTTALVMAAVVRPGNYVEAIVGFGLAGAAVALVAGPRGERWALLAPAIYFPLHIVIAIGRVIASGGTRAVRTDPPPTDALVPLSMILAAGLAGILVGRMLQSRETKPR